jgi:hypothetical protein
MKQSQLLNEWHIHNKKFNEENKYKSLHIMRKRPAYTHARPPPYFQLQEV